MEDSHSLGLECNIMIDDHEGGGVEQHTVLMIKVHFDGSIVKILLIVKIYYLYCSQSAIKWISGATFNLQFNGVIFIYIITLNEVKSIFKLYIYIYLFALVTRNV